MTSASVSPSALPELPSQELGWPLNEVMQDQRSPQGIGKGEARSQNGICAKLNCDPHDHIATDAMDDIKRVADR